MKNPFLEKLKRILLFQKARLVLIFIAKDVKFQKIYI
jgi:hypothetical protein